MGISCPISKESMSLCGEFGIALRKWGDLGRSFSGNEDGRSDHRVGAGTKGLPDSGEAGNWDGRVDGGILGSVAGAFGWGGERG